MKIRSLLISFTCMILLSCAETEKDKLTRLVKEWDGKEIVFPDNIVYTIYGTDTVDYQTLKTNYTIVSYMDSVGCTSCKMQMHRWKEYMNEINSLPEITTSFRFIFHPKEKKELSYLLKRDNFDFPVWIDINESFNKSNNLPVNRLFHTFLLDDKNKVIAIGDPIVNPKVKELYHSIINDNNRGKRNQLSTLVSTSKNEVDFGEFDWQQERRDTIQLHNIGDNTLTINDIISSCGCLRLNYSREPVKSGDKIDVIVIYKADKAEFFNKTISIYSNAEKSPIEIKIKGISKNS